MKLSAWMARERLDDELLTERLAAVGYPYSVHTVAKWRRKERIPRPAAMAALSVVTDGEVTANDFVDVACTFEAAE